MAILIGDYTRSQLRETIDIASKMLQDKALHTTLELASKACVTSLQGGGRVLLAGNGGSAADSQHIAAELVGRFAFDRPSLPAIALTTDTSILTSISNDYGYNELFARQVEAHGCAGDVFIAYSTSGRSRNILFALERAHSLGLTCIGMTGTEGYEMQEFCAHLFRVPSTITAKIQEGHLILGHILCGLIETLMFADHQE